MTARELARLVAQGKKSPATASTSTASTPMTPMVKIGPEQRLAEAQSLFGTLGMGAWDCPLDGGAVNDPLLVEIVGIITPEGGVRDFGWAKWYRTQLVDLGALTATRLDEHTIRYEKAATFPEYVPRSWRESMEDNIDRIRAQEERIREIDYQNRAAAQRQAEEGPRRIEQHRTAEALRGLGISPEGLTTLPARLAAIEAAVERIERHLGITTDTPDPTQSADPITHTDTPEPDTATDHTTRLPWRRK